MEWLMWGFGAYGGIMLWTTISSSMWRWMPLRKCKRGQKNCIAHSSTREVEDYSRERGRCVSFERKNTKLCNDCSDYRGFMAFAFPLPLIGYTIKYLAKGIQAIVAPIGKALFITPVNAIIKSIAKPNE